MNAFAVWIPGTALLMAGLLLLALGSAGLATALALIVPGALLESLGVLLWIRQRKPLADRKATSAYAAMSYLHTQVGWPIRLSLFGGALALVAAGALTPEAAPMPWVMLIAAAVMFGAGFVFGSLSIQLDGARLHWHFGAGWPRRSIALETVSSVEMTRTRFWEGWGIHATRRGWLYNVAGYDAVLIRLRDGSSLLLGTDEPRRLKDTLDRALKSRRST